MAIIPEQQVQTSTLRGVDPTQFLQQAYREQQANVAAFNQMNTAIQQEAQKFIQKQEEKKQKEMTYSAILPYIQQMSGGDAKQADALAKQIANNPASSSAILNMVKMSQSSTPFEPRSREIGGVTYVETEPDKFERLKEAKGLTPGDVTALSKLMERPEFEDIKFDETTGEAYMEVPNKETLRPFDKKRVPVPQEIQQLPGFEQFSRMRRTATAPRDYGQMGMRVVK
jgi:hypothetical protein